MRRRAGLVLLVAAAVGATQPAHARSYGGREIPDEPAGLRGGITSISEINQNGGIFGPGYSPLEYEQVVIEGVVQVGTGVLDPFDFPGALSTWIYVADATGAVAVADSGRVQTDLVPGDRVRVSGTVFTQGRTRIRGTRTVDLSQSLYGGGTVEVIGSGSVTPAEILTAAELVTNGAPHEGNRARINDLTLLASSPWPAAGTTAFARATDGADTVRFLVDNQTDLDGTGRPTAAFDLIGFVAQDDAPPFNDQHYLYPASRADLIRKDGSGTVTVDPPGALVGVTTALTFTLTGEQSTIETLEIDIPASWGWSGSPTDVVLSGGGFAGATAASTGPPWTVRVTGAAVTAAAPGVLTVANATAPGAVGTSTFATRTAVAGGTPTPIAESPVVEVVADVPPGNVVINELLPVSPSGSAREESEFIELRNKTPGDLDIGGWTLADIGRTASCTLDRRWAFPAGTVLPGSGFLVVCRTALDPNNPGNPNDDRGFRVVFPSFPAGVPLYEMFDATGEETRMDDPATPNLVLLDDTVDDDQIALLGGSATNGGQCESPNVPGRLVPYAELVVLRDVLGREIDAAEYHEIGPCHGDFCTGPWTGPDDAYPYGAPKPGHTLGRDAASTDTDVSRDDFLPATVATPGVPNQPGDTVPPALVSGVGNGVSASVIEIRYDEAVDEASATDPAHYWVSGPSGEDVVVHRVISDPEEAQRHYFLAIDPLPALATGTLHVSGVTDLVIGSTGGNTLETSAPFTIPGEARSVCEIQEFDESGFSPLQGTTVVFAGFVTLGDIPPVAEGALPPTDRVSIWVQEPNGCGVNVFAFLPDNGTDYVSFFPDVREFGVRLDDFVIIRGNVTEYVSSTSGSGAVTEVAGVADDPAFYRFLTRGAAGPEPIEASTVEVNDERLEGTLVHTVGTVINSNNLAAWIDDGSGATQVFQNFGSLDLTRFTVGDRLDVTGIVTQFDSSEPFFSGYELVPQNQETVFKVDGAFANDGPAVSVERRVLVPDLGEEIEIVTRAPRRSDMIVEIYDAVGRKVVTLYDGVGLGELRFRWNGKGQDGNIVDPGVYVCHARAVALDGGSVKSAAAPIVVGLRLDGPGGGIGGAR